jgi:hypothetical protein
VRPKSSRDKNPFRWPSSSRLGSDYFKGFPYIDLKFLYPCNLYILVWLWFSEPTEIKHLICLVCPQSFDPSLLMVLELMTLSSSAIKSGSQIQTLSSSCALSCTGWNKTITHFIPGPGTDIIHLQFFRPHYTIHSHLADCSLKPVQLWQLILRTQY